jgi:glycosyltransferase 2 family protein
LLSEGVSIDENSAHRYIRRVLLALLRLAIGVSLLAYLAKAGIVDFRALGKIFTAWPITVAAMILLLLDSALMSARLSWLFRPHGLNLRFGVSLQLTLVSFFFATFLPGAAGGDLAKLFYTARANNSRRIEIMTVVLLDRAIGLFSLLLLPLIFAPMFAQVIRSVPALRSLLLAVGLIAFGAFVVFLLFLSHKPTANRVPVGALQRLTKSAIAQEVLGTIATYRKHSEVLLTAVGVSLLANLFLVFVTMLGLLAVAPSSWMPGMCLVIPIGHIVNSLPLTPGGLGVGETAFDALFNITGLRGGAEALLCSRIWTALVGLLGFAFYLRGVRRKVFDEEVVADETSPPVLETMKS